MSNTQFLPWGHTKSYRKIKTLHFQYFYGDNIHCHSKWAPFEKKTSNETTLKIKYHVYFLWQEQEIQMPVRVSKGEGDSRSVEGTL